MLVRAGASNREMAQVMGVDVKRLFTAVFGVGAALCALAGAMLGPLLAVEVGMGESILILAFVVIVIGGIGSIRGAFAGALVVGIVDTLGRTLLPMSLRAVLPPAMACQSGSFAGLHSHLRPDGRGAVLAATRVVPGARRLMRPSWSTPLHGRIALAGPACTDRVPARHAGDGPALLRGAGEPYPDLRAGGEQPEPCSWASAAWCASAMPPSSGPAPTWWRS